MFNFLKKKKKKVYDKWFLLIFSTVVVCIGIGSELLKGTSALDETPANPAFDDINFYKCVVDAYNEENDTEYDYTYNLSDEELVSIINVNCSGYHLSNEDKVSSVKGLEKMLSLNQLDVMGNKLTELDVTANLELSGLSVSGNQLTEIDLSNNTKLTLFSAFANQLSFLDLSNNVELHSLYLDGNELTELDLNNNLKLSHLEIAGNPLVAFDIVDNVNLEILRVSGSFDSLDVTKNIKLIELSVSSDKLLELNVTNNNLLQYLSVTGCAITSIDLSANKELTYLNLGSNKLTELDVSNNLKLTELGVIDNNLSELDLSNNSQLLSLNTTGNLFDKTLNLYKDKNLKLDNWVILPKDIDSNLFTLVSNNTSIVSVDDNELVTAVSGGTALIMGGVETDEINYKIGNNTINVIDISSEEYVINEEENFVYTGNQDLDIGKIDVVVFDLNVDRNKLKILDEEENLVSELDILKVDFGTLNVKENIISLNDEIVYEDFISNITKSENIIYKIKDDEEEVTSDSKIIDGMVLEIYFKDILLDTYEIKIVSEIVNDVIFNDNIVLDEENGYIKYNGFEISVEQLLTNLEIVGDARVFVSDTTGNEKKDNDVVVTGDTFTVFVGSEKQAEYKIAVRGDSNGDGKVSLTDLVQLRKHIVSWRNPQTGVVEEKTGIYFYALDMNNDGNISLTDLVRVRKVIVGIDIDE